MIKKILTLCMAACCCVQLNAQDKGVQFRDLTFQEALQAAEKEGKLVFMDCYTSWCGPCKHMTENIFPQEIMGNFFNDKFVNVKFDMEKGEGPVLRAKFRVNSYPTFFILRPDGTVQHRIAGARPSERFLECAKRGVEEKTSLRYLTELYNSGKYSEEELAAYRTALSDAGERTALYRVTAKEFEGMSDAERCSANRWYLYDMESVSGKDERFLYILEHKKDFDKNVGKEKVDAKLHSCYESQLMVLKNKASKMDITVPVNEIKEQIQQVDFSGKDKIKALIRYIGLVQGKDIDGLLNFIDTEVEKLPKGCLIELTFYEFIIKEGTPEQIKRYLDMENKINELLYTPQMRKILKTTFTKFREKAKEKSI